MFGTSNQTLYKAAEICKTKNCPNSCPSLDTACSDLKTQMQKNYEDNIAKKDSDCFVCDDLITKNSKEVTFMQPE